MTFWDSFLPWVILIKLIKSLPKSITHSLLKLKKKKIIFRALLVPKQKWAKCRFCLPQTYYLLRYQHAPPDGAFFCECKNVQTCSKFLFNFFFNKNNKQTKKQENKQNTRIFQEASCHCQEKYFLDWDLQLALYPWDWGGTGEQMVWMGGKQGGVDGFTSQGSEKRRLNLDLETVDRTCLRQRYLFC